MVRRLFIRIAQTLPKRKPRDKRNVQRSQVDSVSEKTTGHGEVSFQWQFAQSSSFFFNSLNFRAWLPYGSVMNILTRTTGTAGLVLLSLAVLTVGLTTDFGMVKAYRRLLAVTQPDGSLLSPSSSARRVSAADRLILDGDATRPSKVLRQRAIWEAAPTNKVFFHHYLTILLSDYNTLEASPAACYAKLAAEIEAGRSVDPNNARLDFVLAAKLLEQAMESKTAVTGVTADGKAKVRSEQVVKDRAKLAEAMTLLERGLKRPVYRRYVGNMLAARLAILGPPESLSDQMLQLNLVAETPMPDLPLMRNLARGAGAYAAVLIEEKRTNEAQYFLDVWKPLALKLTADSFALMDVLMAAAIVKEAELRVPELYARLGMAAKADAVRAETRALTTPLVAWNRARSAFQTDPAVRLRREAFARHTGILATMLLPALTEYPSAAELAPNRLLDYVLIEDLFLTGVALLMLVAMLAGLIWLRYLRRKLPAADLAAGGVPWRQAVVRVWWCVVLPVLVYLVITRFTTLGGRIYGLPYVWPRLVFQLGMLGVTMVLISTLYQGSLTSTRIHSGSPLLVVLTLGVMVGTLLLPVSWLTAEHKTASLVAMAVPLMILVGSGVWRIIQWRASLRRSTPALRYEGVAVMVLMLGLGVMVLTLGAHRVLRVEERRYVSQETLLRVDPAQGGFTVAEARLAKSLRDQVLKVNK